VTASGRDRPMDAQPDNNRTIAAKLKKNANRRRLRFDTLSIPIDSNIFFSFIVAP
jgi:hypothetical protein